MFDGSSTEFEPGIALDQPSAEALSHILRHRELWPKGFEWNYARCDRCAIGLAKALWRVSVPAKFTKFMGLSPASADHVFFNVGVDLNVLNEEVTPYHVADAIDAHLAKPKRSSHV